MMDTNIDGKVQRVQAMLDVKASQEWRKKRLTGCKSRKTILPRAG
jgi:hypothetical protein